MLVKKLISPIDLIKKSLRIYFKKENFWYLTKILLVFVVVSVAILIASTFVGLLFKNFSRDFSNITDIINTGPLFFVFLFTLMLFIAWLLLSTVAIIKSISLVLAGQTFGVVEVFKFSWTRAWKYLPLLAIDSLIYLIYARSSLPLIFSTLQARMFSILLGVFTIFLTFAGFIIVEENLNAFAAIKKSIALVKGCLWPVLGRALVINLFPVGVIYLLNFMQYIGFLTTIFFFPYFLLLPYLLYEDIKRVKAQSESV